MTAEQIRAECERLFQNRGAKVYYFDLSRARFLAFGGTAKQALRFADPGEQVWARHRVRGATGWRFQHIGTGS